MGAVAANWAGAAGAPASSLPLALQNAVKVRDLPVAGQDRANAVRSRNPILPPTGLAHLIFR